MIVVVCSYCGKVYKIKESGREGVEISHGACTECAAIEIAKIAAMDQEIQTRTA